MLAAPLVALTTALAAQAPVSAPGASGASGAPAATASAGDAARILVVAPAGERDARVEEIYGGLRAAGLQPVELDERAGVDREPGPKPVLGVRDDARAFVQEAKARFRELDLEATRAAIDAAVDEVLRLERPEDALEIFVDALLLRASVALQAGVDDDARAAFVLVARLDPARTELHPGLYPPSMCDAYATARAAELSPGAGLVVRPRVAGFAPAEVLVDGRALPAGALAGTSELLSGPHLVTVRAPGAVPFSRVVELDAATATVLEPFLAPPDAAERRAALVDAARRAVDDDAKKAALAALTSLTAASAALFVTSDGAAALFSPRGLEPLPIPGSSDGTALGRATLALFQAPARRDAGLPVDDGPDLVAVLVGSGIAIPALGAVVAVAFWALLPEDPPPPPPYPVVINCCVN